MTITIRQIKDRLRKWRRRRAFNKLSPTEKKIIRFMGDDPDTLEEKEREDGSNDD
ncbi:MAG: hypothetical protein U9Q07_03865 [Planctomycetota bacterium]|nr:hypothetical protein [Planctomycetota bacterium]